MPLAFLGGHLHSWIDNYGYEAVFVLVGLESIGVPLPGETALITAALYAATTHHLHIAIIIAVAAAAAIIRRRLMLRICPVPWLTLMKGTYSSMALSTAFRRRKTSHQPR